MDHFIDAFKKYSDFTGRATRTQYWMYILFYLIIYIVLTVVDTTLGFFALSLIYSIVMFVPSISIAARRLHDTGRSGWWQLIALIPLLGSLILIFFLVQDSAEDNEYGPAADSTE